MPTIDRRQGMMLAAGLAGLVAMPMLARRAAARPTPGGTLALVEKGDGRLSFYTLPEGRRLGSVALGTQPHEIAADPARRFAYVGAYGVGGWKKPGEGGHAVWVIDLARRSLVRTIDLTPLGRIHAVRIDAAGRLYAMAETASMLARFDDPAQAKEPSRLLPLGGTRSHYLVVRRDGGRAYVADTMSGTVIMVAPDDPAAPPVKQAIGAAPEALALSADERTLYAIDRPVGVIHALDAQTLKPRGQRAMRGEAVRVVTQGDGRLVVANRADHSLSRLDPTTLAEQARLPLPDAPVGLTLADGMLYAAMENDRIAIVDLARFAIAGGFATGKAPDAGVVF